MLSGRFNIRILGEGEWGRYYVKRIRGVFVPTLVFLLIYTAKDLHPDYGSFFHFCKVFVLNSLGALSHGIFWFVFSLFGMLMVAPFLAKAFKGPSRDFQNAFFLVWLIWTVTYYCSDNMAIDFTWSYPFRGYLFFFCLGSFLEDSWVNELNTKLLASIGCVAWFANSVITYMGWSKGAFDMSPLFAVSAICLYLLLLRVKVEQSSDFGNVISFIARHSFGFYLAHWLAYEYLQPLFAPLLGTSGLLYQVPLSLIVFATGSLLAAAIEGTVIKAAQCVFDCIVKPFVDSAPK